MSDELVEYACGEQIATITLNRPDKLNAVNDDMVRQIAAALRRFDTDDDARIAILCGRGRAFSTGADVRQRQLRSREEFERYGGAQAPDASSHDLLLRSVNWKPVMAAVHGYVLGLALGLMLECDLIVAEEGTKFQVTETPRGLSGAKYWALLNFRGGGAFATDVALTGRFFTAEEARAANVIERVAPEGALMATARATGGRGGEEPAARRALHGPCAALPSGTAVARRAAAGEPRETAPHARILPNPPAPSPRSARPVRSRDAECSIRTGPTASASASRRRARLARRRCSASAIRRMKRRSSPIS